ncbi:MAG: GlsB/YeaQ/YmgE family stress response membrane protein [Flavobacteriales bacterium]
MGILISVLVGAVAGWLAGQIMKGSGFGLLVNILLGIVGGFVGNLVFAMIGLDATNIIGRIICATVGAVLLIALGRAVSK